MQTDNHNFRLFLKMYRIRKDLSQRDMAKKLNVSNGYLSAVELGKRRLTAKFLSRLLVGFNFKGEQLNDLLSALEKDLGYRSIMDRQDVRIATVMGFLEVEGEALKYIKSVSKEIDPCQ